MIKECFKKLFAKFIEKSDNHQGSKNPFFSKHQKKRKDNVYALLKQKVKEYDKKADSNTYVWIEKYHESRKKHKSNVIKSKKKAA